MATTVVQKKKGAEVVKAAKESKAYRRKNKNKLNKAAKSRYHKMTHEEKMKHLAHQVFLRAMRHGATEAEAKKAKAAYIRRRKNRHAGTHAAGQLKSARDAQRQLRDNLRKKTSKISEKHKNALSKIRSLKVAPAKRAQLRKAEKTRYAQERSALAAERLKATKSHAKTVDKIKKSSKKKGAFRLKDFISNFQKTPLSKRGKRLKTDDGVAKIAEKHFTKPSGAVKKPKASKAAPASKKPAAKVTLPALDGPKPGGQKLKKDGTPAKKPGRKPKAASASPVQAPAKPAKSPTKKPAASNAPAAPAGGKLKKDGTPAKKPGRKSNAEKAAAAQAAKPAAKAAKAPKATKAKETKAPAKESKKPAAAKAPAKAAKAPAKAAKAPAKAAKASGGAKKKEKANFS